MKRYLAFTVADLPLAIPVDHVSEVVEVPPITRIPRPARHIEGLASLRGKTIAVVDLRRRLGLVNPVTGRSTRMIVVLPGGRDEAVGLIVDSVGEILTPGETEPSGGASIPWVAEGLLTGALEVEGRQVLLPDLAKLAGLS
jgi:purine-binding chemotaxis protein CheW